MHLRELAMFGEQATAVTVRVHLTDVPVTLAKERWRRLSDAQPGLRLAFHEERDGFSFDVVDAGHAESRASRAPTASFEEGSDLSVLVRAQHAWVDDTSIAIIAAALQDGVVPATSTSAFTAHTEALLRASLRDPSAERPHRTDLEATTFPEPLSPDEIAQRIGIAPAAVAMAAAAHALRDDAPVRLGIAFSLRDLVGYETIGAFTNTVVVDVRPKNAQASPLLHMDALLASARRRRFLPAWHSRGRDESPERPWLSATIALAPPWPTRTHVDARPLAAGRIHFQVSPGDDWRLTVGATDLEASAEVAERVRAWCRRAGIRLDVRTTVHASAPHARGVLAHPPDAERAPREAPGVRMSRAAASLLGAPVDPERDLFDQGLDSLRAARLIALLAAEGVELPLRSLYELRSIAAIDRGWSADP